jgi:hypothetical protein
MIDYILITKLKPEKSVTGRYTLVLKKSLLKLIK